MRQTLTWLAVLGALALLLAACGGPGPTQIPRGLDVIVGTPALNIHVDRDNFSASPDGIATLDLGSHGTVLWASIDRRNASNSANAPRTASQVSV